MLITSVKSKGIKKLYRRWSESKPRRVQRAPQRGDRRGSHVFRLWVKMVGRRYHLWLNESPYLHRTTLTAPTRTLTELPTFNSLAHIFAKPWNVVEVSTHLEPRKRIASANSLRKRNAERQSRQNGRFLRKVNNTRHREDGSRRDRNEHRWYP